MREIKFRFYSYALKSVSPSVTLRGLATSPMFTAMGGDMELLEPMQYTGLTDRKGNEIYEGDILQYYQDNRTPSSNLKVVEWTDSKVHSGWNIAKGITEMRWEIIGNIYENKELIK